jgi:hypothetical protein
VGAAVIRTLMAESLGECRENPTFIQRRSKDFRENPCAP